MPVRGRGRKLRVLIFMILTGSLIVMGQDQGLSPAGAQALPTVTPGSLTTLWEGDFLYGFSAALPVHLSAPSTGWVSVEWETIVVDGAPGDQATPVDDYYSQRGTIGFSPGQTETTAGININGDFIREPNEYIVVSFKNPTNAVMGGFWGLGFLTITDDDGPPPVLTVGSASIAEGGGGAWSVLRVPITLSTPATRTVSMNCSLIHPPGLPGSPADPGTDYLDIYSNPVQFLPGQSALDFTLAVLGDDLVEPDEYALISCTSATNAVIGGFWGLGFGVILNDD